MKPSKALCFGMLLLCAIDAGCTTKPKASFSQRPIRVFRLQFQLADFKVPEGEIWKLSWRSPYAPGDTCPSYDVRIIQGAVMLGVDRSIQAIVFESQPGKRGLLDLSAANGLAVVWLESGTKFSIANELLRIEVERLPSY